MSVRAVLICFASCLACCAHAVAQTQNTSLPLHYVPLPTPCRAVDTRLTGGSIAAGTSQSFNPGGGGCSIPLPSTGRIAYAINVTVVPHGTLGYLTVWPTGSAQPIVSTLNSLDGRTKASAAIATGGNGGEISIYATDTTDLVLDVSGYFTDDPASYVYVPMTPCRLVDTRIDNGTSFGAPSLVAGQQRVFQLANSSCNLPGTALANGGAVSLNVTAVPIADEPISYLTVWGTSSTEPQPPLISTLNVPNPTTTANAAIVTINPGTSQSVSVYTTNSTDLVLDITGYFAPASSSPAGLSLYTMAPCRVLDTREESGAFQGELNVSFTSGNECGVPASAKAYVTNATVVPAPVLPFLTLWPNNTPQPIASTLNASDGSISSNMAIVTTSNGSIDAFAYSPTELVMDLAGYFALSPASDAPTVVFLGDQLTWHWMNDEMPTHPLWINAGTPGGVAGETSGQMLARFQTDVIDQHPNVVNIIVGAADMETAGWDPPCDTSGGPTVRTCSNLSQMAHMAVSAGITVLIGTTPLIGTPPVTFTGTDAVIDGNIALFASNLYKIGGNDPGGISSSTEVDYQTALVEAGDWTDDAGITANALGEQTLTNMAETAIAAAAMNTPPAVRAH